MNDATKELIHAARSVQGLIRLPADRDAGTVGAAVRTASGRIYTGICLDLACGIGFCAEHSAVAEMLKHRETQIESVVAVNSTGVLPPCGRCRELMLQIDPRNTATRVVLGERHEATLGSLMPSHWRDAKEMG